MFIAALFAIAKIWQQPKCPSKDEKIKKVRYIYTYTMEYYVAIKRMKFCLFEATWVDLEDITLSERCQTEKGKYYMISLICGI